jgi:hypothetical protein
MKRSINDRPSFIENTSKQRLFLQQEELPQKRGFFTTNFSFKINAHEKSLKNLHAIFKLFL